LIDSRNNWYQFFYSSIAKKQSISYDVFHFVFISFMFFIVESCSNFFKVLFIKKQRLDHNLLQYSYIDFSQRFSEDNRLKANYFIDFFVKFLKGVGILTIFIPKLHFLLKDSFYYVFTIFVIYICFSLFINYGFIRRLFVFYYDNFLEKEAQLRKFLFVWFQRECIQPFLFDKSKLVSAIVSMKQYYFIKAFSENFRNFYDAIGLILPFVMFYSLYLDNFITFAILMQLINLWVQINYAVTNLEQSYQAYISFMVSHNRLNFKVQKLNIINDSKLILKNITIIIEKKIIFKDLNFLLNAQEQVNFVAPNKRGKTTLMKVMQGYIPFLGEIKVPKNILWIPEKVVWPEYLKLCETKKFQENCNFMNVLPNLYFESASGSEKWKLIASYAMLFDFVVWDDPFWGVQDAQKELNLILPKLKAVLIFSQQPLSNIKIIQL